MEIAKGMFDAVDVLSTSLASGLAVWLVSWLRPPPHARDHSALLALLNDVLQAGRHKTHEGGLILQEACAQLYGPYLPVRAITILLQCSSPAEAIRTYARHRRMLEDVPNLTAIRFKYDQAPYRLWCGRRIPVTMLKGIAGYLALIVPSLLLAQWIMPNVQSVLRTKNVSMIVTLLCMLGIAGMLFLCSIVTLFSGMNGQQAEKEVAKDLGSVFISTPMR